MADSCALLRARYDELRERERSHIVETSPEMAAIRHRLAEETALLLEATRKLNEAERLADAAKKDLLQGREHNRQFSLELAKAQQRASDLGVTLSQIAKLLENNGCDCSCDHHHDEHDDGCDRCLGCRIGFVIQKSTT